MITIHFTEQEAQQLLNVLTQLPIPFNVSQPLVQKIGQAIALDQQLHMQRAVADPANWPADIRQGAMQGLGAGLAVEGAGDAVGQAVRSMHPRTRPVAVDDTPRPHNDADFEPSEREKQGLPEHDA